MHIKKSWFYKTSELNVENLKIWENLKVIIFDTDDTLKKIEIWENSSVEYFSYFKDVWEYKKHILLSWETSKCISRNFVFSTEGELKVKILWEISSSHSKIDTHIVSFVWKKSFINLDGIVQINSGIKKVEGYLEEENIFLWTWGKVRWVPTLFVRSDDVKASHSCKMEKISDEKLFYLRSRWVEKEGALHMILKSYIISIFWGLGKTDKDFCSNLINTILKEI